MSKRTYIPSAMIEKWNEEYQESAELRGEFTSVESYVAYKKADARDRVRHFAPGAQTK